MDHFAVARGDAVADAARRLGNDRAMPAKGKRPRHRQADDARPDHQNVYDRLPLPKDPSLRDIQSRPLAGQRFHRTMTALQAEAETKKAARFRRPPLPLFRSEAL